MSKQKNRIPKGLKCFTYPFDPQQAILLNPRTNKAWYVYGKNILIHDITHLLSGGGWHLDEPLGNQIVE